MSDIQTIVYSDIPVDDVFNDGDEDIALDASGDYRRKSKTARDKQVYDKAKTSIVAGDNITVTADECCADVDGCEHGEWWWKRRYGCCW